MTRDQAVKAAAADVAAQQADRARLIKAHAYDPSVEGDACGVGLIASVDGTPRREVVTLAIAALKAVWHRGAVDADGKTGDGAGVRLDVPQEFFRHQVERTGNTPHAGPIGVGMVFLPRTDLRAQDRSRSVVEAELLRAGFRLCGWRQVPVHPAVIGEKAEATRPEIEQVLFYDPDSPETLNPSETDALEKALFVVRRRIEKRALREGLVDLYLCSLSAQSVVYKGLFLAEEIDAFYPDLADEAFVSTTAIFHQRYSTNTFPKWRLAQPFRTIAHNGEINTLGGNRNWMRSHEIGLAKDAFSEEDAAAVRPIIQPESSDSAALDQTFEAMVRCGREAPLVKAMLIPEAWSKRASVVPEARRALYAYCNAVMEPWDGPAAVVACDGRWALAGLDRSGLRPLRWSLTDDGILAVGSEAGMCRIDDKRINARGSVEPGRMIGVDMVAGRIFVGDELVDHVAQEDDYAAWAKAVRDIEDEIGPGPEVRVFPEDGDLVRRLSASGVTREDLEAVLAPMIDDAKEALGSMGDDTPLAVLSQRHRPLSHYFRQKFSQVTNPPIDPLREARVMSLRTRFNNLGAVRAGDGALPEILCLDGPILTNGMTARLCERLADHTKIIDCTFLAVGPATGSGESEARPGDDLFRALDGICSDAVEVVERAAAKSDDRNDRHMVHLVLTDEFQSHERAPLPMILVASAVHRRLLDSGLRRMCAITVKAGECFDPHYAAVLIGVGATCVNPYLAFDTAVARGEAGLHEGRTGGTAAGAVKKAFEAGLLKILSKSGVSVISAYRGGCLFEALGLSRVLVDEYFPGMTSRISGIGLAGIEANVRAVHGEAWRSDEPHLDVGGFYKLRATGEKHAVDAPMIEALQKATRENDPVAWRAYLDVLASRPAMQLRDLLEFEPKDKPIGLDQVESTSSIYRRFLTPGMSLGALSPEAHGVLNVAMNRLNARSVSGEGGEDPARYKPLPNGDNMNSAVKQIASGRFGVTAEYLNQCIEIEIKIAQGAKPGEGGQLPGFKVTQFIADMRLATPGVTLISPPPHHDIYSIEDLAQLIYDLKQINPDARVCVKLVASSGVGAVAAGVAKAKADIVHIAGHSGGSGASPLTSIKFAGAPWELGLAEAHQTLALNRLRDTVRLRTDGGLRSGRDIVIAAMLGAQEFGIGTLSLIAMGCLMVRQCHSNTCPVGICTQDEDLRKRFHGAADHVVNLMTFLAEDVRGHLAQLGAASLDDVVGRTDLLRQVSRGEQSDGQHGAGMHLDGLDLNPLLVRVDDGWRPKKPGPRNAVPPSLDEQILEDAEDVFRRGKKMRLSYTVRNVDRAIGARISSRIVREHGPKGLPDGLLTVRLEGSAGQSLGAFSMKGLRLELEGEANDYVGKGLSGAEIIVRPSWGATAHAATHADVIIGNTCLYGATSGLLLAAGCAGERFAVRNSGADAVVEGVSANGCEYMTGGAVVILGPVGDNFGAGMTGGDAFVYDPEDTLASMLNDDTVEAHPLVGGSDDAAEVRCRTLIERHVEATHSKFATRILENWDVERTRMAHVRGRR